MAISAGVSLADAAEREAVRKIAQKLQHHGPSSLSRGEVKRLQTYEAKVKQRLRTEGLDQLSQAELGELVGSPPAVLRKWEEAKPVPLPRNADGSYSLRAVVAWMKERWMAGGAAGRAEDEATELEIKKLKLEEKRFALEQRRGEWIRRDRVEEEAAVYAGRLRRRLEGMGRLLAAVITGRPEADVMIAIDQEMARICDELAAGLRETATSDGVVPVETAEATR